jgi:hypothetical protein
MGSAPRWRAGDESVLVGDGSELAAIERAKRAAKPWLYETEFTEEATGASRYCRMAPVGVPISVKIGVAIGQARRRDQLTAVTAHATAAFACGFIGQDAANAINEAILEKEKGLAWHRAWWQRIAPPRVLNLIENRRPRIEHRARLAASGPMPPELAKQFTVGELSVMKIVADEVARRCTCGLSKGEISDRSQASETTVHNAIRKAHNLSMLGVKHRAMVGKRNLPNLITIIDTEWMLWVMRPKYREIREDRIIREQVRQKAAQTQGANRGTPQSVHIYKKDETGAWRNLEEVDRGMRAARHSPRKASLPLWRSGVNRRGQSTSGPHALRARARHNRW